MLTKSAIQVWLPMTRPGSFFRDFNRKPPHEVWWKRQLMLKVSNAIGWDSRSQGNLPRAG